MLLFAHKARHSHRQLFGYTHKGHQGTCGAFRTACFPDKTSPANLFLQKHHWTWTNGLQEAEQRQEQLVLTAFKKTLAPRKVTSTLSEVQDRCHGGLPVPISLVGYIKKWAHLSKNLSFAVLSDPAHTLEIQLISSPSRDAPEEGIAHQAAKAIRANSPVYIEGQLRRKGSKEDGTGSEDVSNDLSDLEISITGPGNKITCLNSFPDDIILKNETQFGAGQRHLQLRNNAHLRSAFSCRNQMQDLCRAVLRNFRDMLEIETPLLFKSTSEGAREFLVPTRREGFAYALPQSPQQFKQMLMASGIAGYFQFAKCFRDEDLRADRQPEFTQLDLEMSFSSAADIMELSEMLVRSIWKKCLSVDMPLKFPRESYDAAMTKYGSDKPDLRIPIPPFASVGHMIPIELVSMTTSLKKPTMEAMVLPLQCHSNDTRAFVVSFLESMEGRMFQDNPHGAPGVFVYDSSKPLCGLAPFGFEAAENLERDYELVDGHLVILQARPDTPHSGGSTVLGDMRRAMFLAAVNAGHLSTPSWKSFEPLWITDFPLFSPVDPDEPGQGGVAGFASTHHPFTSPKSPKDVDLLESDPSRVIGDHYDLVINGEEVAGGSQRIHHAAMQEYIFRKILKMDEGRIAEFAHLLEALRAGCPPHAGIAFGFDRLVAMIMSSLLERAMTIRDVIAFPKTGKGDDLMVKSPGLLTDEALATYHLKKRK